MKPASGSLPTIPCRTCGRYAAAVARLCPHCRNPLANDAPPADNQLCLDALLQTLAEARTAGRSDIAPPSAWQAYLSLFWARPETALVLAAQQAAFHDWLGEADGLTLLDAGCGDGLHTATLTGWRFDPGFDAFGTLATDTADPFDTPADTRPRSIRCGTARLLGVDLKANTLRRAAASGCFAATFRGDLTALPLADQSADIVFSNMLGQLDDASLTAALREVRAVLRPGGRLVASSLTPAFAGTHYFWNLAQDADRRGDADNAARFSALDRGRHEFERLRDEATWHRMLEEAGLRLLDRRGTMDASVMRFWDVGFRPFTAELMAAAGQLRAAGAWDVGKQLILRLLDATFRPLLGAAIDPEQPCMQMMLAERLG